MSSLNGFGAALRALRERARMRQEDLAAAVGVSRGMIGRYETEKKRPAVDTLGGLLDALDADLYDLGVEARRASGREVTSLISTTTLAARPRLQLSDEEWAELDREAELTAMGLVAGHIRNLRGKIGESGSD